MYFTAPNDILGVTEADVERLVQQEYRRVASVAFRITRDEADAEDVAEGVFAKLLRVRLSNVDDARKWLCQTAVHAALSAVRNRIRRNGGERRTELNMVRAALLRIGPEDSGLLALRYSGFPYHDMAAIIGIGEADVGRRLSCAERALKREMERETFERRRLALHAGQCDWCRARKALIGASRASVRVLQRAGSRSRRVRLLAALLAAAIATVAVLSLHYLGSST